MGRMFAEGPANVMGHNVRGKVGECADVVGWCHIDRKRALVQSCRGKAVPTHSATGARAKPCSDMANTVPVAGPGTEGKSIC